MQIFAFVSRFVGIPLVALAIASAAAAAPEDRHLPRVEDGSIHWTIDRGAGGRQGLLLIAQGSGCTPASGSPNIAQVAALLPDFAVITVEKQGIPSGSRWRASEPQCSAAYRQLNTVSQRAADTQRVIETLRKAPWWNGQLVLFGGSEGGAVVAMLAPRVRPSAVIIMSTALGRSFRSTFLQLAPPAEREAAERTFGQIKTRPLSGEVYAGQSFRWWADILDHDLTADVLATRSPVLLLQGGHDQSAPVEVARRVAVEFSKSDRRNLTYWEFPNYDHHMRDPSGVSHLGEVLKKAQGWLHDALSRQQPRGPER